MKKKIIVPTDEQVIQEIDLLKEMKPKIRRITHFGDDNHEKIDAAIAALENTATEDDYWGDNDEESERYMDIRISFVEAMEWKEGKNRERPSDGWKDLVRS